MVEVVQVVQQEGQVVEGQTEVEVVVVTLPVNLVAQVQLTITEVVVGQASVQVVVEVAGIIMLVVVVGKVLQ